MEHVLPLSRGGEHSICNIAVACHSCDSKKRDSLPNEFNERYVRLAIGRVRQRRRDTATGVPPIGDRVLDALGFERVVTFQRKVR